MGFHKTFPSAQRLNLWLTVAALCGGSLAFAQQQVGQYLAKEAVLSFQSFPDATGHVAIVYNTSTATLPKTYKTHFVSVSAAGQSKVMLPLNIRLFGYGYTDKSFLFFMRTKEQESRKTPQVDVMEMDKDSSEIKKMYRFDFKDEELLLSFSDLGAFHMITVLEKPYALRIRKFTKAEDPVIVTHPVSEKLAKELLNTDRGYQFAHNHFELPPAEAYAMNKIFLWEEKLYLLTGYVKEPKKTNSYLGVRFLEVPLSGASELRARELPLSFKGDINCYPVNDRLFLFECDRTRFSLSIASLASFEVSKTLTQENEGGSLLMGVYYDTDKFSFWKPSAVPVGYNDRILYSNTKGIIDFLLNKDPDTMEKRLKKFGGEKPFVYARQVKDHIVLSLGEFHFPTTTYLHTTTTPKQPISTPYGNFTTQEMTTSYTNTVEGDTPLFTYVTSALRSDLSGSAVLVPEIHSIEKVGEFADADEQKHSARRYEVVANSTAIFLVGFSKREELFTVWEWKTN